MSRLDGKIAIVSGGANGIGQAVCRRFVAEGAIVTIADINAETGKALADELGSAAEFATLDVRNPSDWQQLVDGVVARRGRLDILVNNAGILATTQEQSIEDAGLDEWRAVNSVNVEGIFLGCQAAVRAMKIDGGAIVNLSSIAGLIGTPYLAAYGASKGAVRQLTKTVAVDCGRKGYGIRCNSVHPGFVDTAMGRKSLGIGGGTIEDRLRDRIRQTPLGIAGHPDDIANGVLFLASDEARFVTGAELVIDGGVTAI